ncbi:hypothetical protein [Thiocapsa sp. C2-2m]|uniref:hypothetical protein n=1 Tax=Thiocapsa sp. C2-2m TaxID=3137395 RepID=UPI0035B3B872
MLYWLFGINRITRKAHRLRSQTSEARDRAELAAERRALFPSRPDIDDRTEREEPFNIK